jgi:hypothetical protein
MRGGRSDGQKSITGGRPADVSAPVYAALAEPHHPNSGRHSVFIN